MIEVPSLKLAWDIYMSTNFVATVANLLFPRGTPSQQAALMHPSWTSLPCGPSEQFLRFTMEPFFRWAHGKSKR
jgi:hypothetical protein